MFDDVTCPKCDEDPTEESLTEAKASERLRYIGYVHKDYRLRCPNGHTWVHGVPEGSPQTDEKWSCDACVAGQYIPRDITLKHDERLAIAVKCELCYYKPPNPLTFEIPDRDTGNNQWAILLGHPKVCGDTEHAEEETTAYLPEP